MPPTLVFDCKLSSMNDEPVYRKRYERDDYGEDIMACCNLQQK